MAWRIAATISTVLLLPVVAERASDSYTQGVIRTDPEEAFPVYASAQNRAEDMQRLSRLLKRHVDSTGPLQKYSHRFRESDKEYSEAAHGLFSSLKKFQESISEFRGKVADSNSEKIDTIKDKMSAWAELSQHIVTEDEDEKHEEDGKNPRQGESLDRDKEYKQPSSLVFEVLIRRTSTRKVRMILPKIEVDDIEIPSVPLVEKGTQ
eukprot:s84_g12.t1